MKSPWRIIIHFQVFNKTHWSEGHTWHYGWNWPIFKKKLPLSFLPIFHPKIIVKLVRDIYELNVSWYTAEISWKQLKFADFYNLLIFNYFIPQIYGSTSQGHWWSKFQLIFSWHQLIFFPNLSKHSHFGTFFTKMMVKSVMDNFELNTSW